MSSNSHCLKFPYTPTKELKNCILLQNPKMSRLVPSCLLFFPLKALTLKPWEKFSHIRYAECWIMFCVSLLVIKTPSVIASDTGSAVVLFECPVTWDILELILDIQRPTDHSLKTT